MKNSPSESALSWAKWIDYTLIVVLSGFCLKYITYFGRSFAEQCVRFSFLNFPIFVGEFLLSVCLLLFVMRTFLMRQKFTVWHYGLLAFYGFVVIKGVLGYLQFGPLALRDAALFYYSLFAVIGFSCYRPEVFKGWVAVVFYLAVFWLAFDSKYNEFWMIPRIFLGCALAFEVSDRRVGALMAAAVLIFTPYPYFISASRSVFLGGFVAVVFFLSAVLFILRGQMRKIVTIVNLFLIFSLAAYIFYFSGSKPAQGLLAVDRLSAFLNEMEEQIRERAPTFVPEKIDNLQVFNPNKAGTAQPVIVESQETVKLADKVTLDQSEESNDIDNSKITAEPNELNMNTSQKPEEAPAPAVHGRTDLVSQMKLGNSVFRLLIWQDALKEITKKKNIFGVSFGKPFRSRSLEMVRGALTEWRRDGWIAMHNSYLNILYRGGLVGLIYIGAAFIGYFYMVRTFVIHQSLTGLLVCGALLMPLFAAFFAVTFELPYSAIPIWTFYGLALRFASNQWSKQAN